jgi:mRNA interferase HigB
MSIIARRTFRTFWEKHSGSEQPLKAWYEIVKMSSWNKPNDIKEIFRSADIVQNNRVAFNIKGNKYRLVVKIQSGIQTVYIKFIGKHSE